MKKKLVLASGEVFYGEGFGYNQDIEGEVVFNTGMTGYQELLSDPSYCGQIVCMTYPLIGNYGINRDDYESMEPSIKGLIVKEVVVLLRMMHVAAVLVLGKQVCLRACVRRINRRGTASSV